MDDARTTLPALLLSLVLTRLSASRFGQPDLWIHSSEHTVGDGDRTFWYVSPTVTTGRSGGTYREGSPGRRANRPRRTRPGDLGGSRFGSGPGVTVAGAADANVTGFTVRTTALASPPTKPAVTDSH